jgi:DNA-binding XRE family transcriptional regulator
MKRVGFMEMVNRLLKWGWLLYLRLKVAFVLQKQRRRSGIRLEEAAQKVRISKKLLLRIELGLESPALWLISRLLDAYQADENAYFFFCCAQFPRFVFKSSKWTTVN